MKNRQLIKEVKQLQKIAGILKEYEEGDENTGYPKHIEDEMEQEYHRGEEMEKKGQGKVKIYDDAIKYAFEMTPELMYEDGELGEAESLIQAEEEFMHLIKASRVNPASTLAYRRFFDNAWGHAEDHGAEDLEDFKGWFKDTAVFTPAYEEAFEQIIK